MQRWLTTHGSHSEVKYTDIEIHRITEQINFSFDFPGSPVKELAIPFIKKIKCVLIKVVALIKSSSVQRERKVKDT